MKVKILTGPVDNVAMEKKVNKFLEEFPDITIHQFQQTFGHDKMFMTMFFTVNKPQQNSEQNANIDAVESLQV